MKKSNKEFMELCRRQDKEFNRELEIAERLCNNRNYYDKRRDEEKRLRG